jgi:hypothetical protein
MYSNEFQNHYNHHHRWQNSLFWAIAFLWRFCQICAFPTMLSWIGPSGFHFFGFHNSIIFTEQGHQLFIHAQTWRARSLYLCPPSDRVAQLYPWAADSLFIAIYVLQGYGGGILTHLPSKEFQNWLQKLYLHTNYEADKVLIHSIWRNVSLLLYVFTCAFMKWLKSVPKRHENLSNCRKTPLSCQNKTEVIQIIYRYIMSHIIIIERKVLL